VPSGTQAIPVVNSLRWVGEDRREPISIEQEYWPTLKIAENRRIFGEKSARFSDFAGRSGAFGYGCAR